MKKLNEMSLNELKALKAKWYQENSDNDNIKKLSEIGRFLGDKLSVNYGPKYELYEEDTETEIYVDDYGGYMTVKINGKMKVSTHNEKLYVPGDWEEIISRLHPKAEEIKNMRLNGASKTERDKLLDELS